ncbi:unnamed protein product, partial [Prorocentrum cordatum]
MSVNASSFGPLFDFLAVVKAKIICAQETRIVESRLGEFQHRAKDLGFHGMWAPALATNAKGPQANHCGVAILVPTNVMITKPPDGDPIIYPGRVVASFVNWGVPGGVIVVSAYLVTSTGLTGENLSILWAIAQRVAFWNAAGFDWILAGDWNSDIAALNARGWIESLAGFPYTPPSATCCKEDGNSKIDYFIACANLSSRLGTAVVVDTYGTIPPPHYPVSIDLLGSDRFCQRLQLASVVCQLTPLQYTKVLQAFYEVDQYCRRIVRDKKTCHHLDQDTVDFLLRGLGMIGDADFDSGLDNIILKADAVLKAARSDSEQAWRGWAKQAFLGGASQAHAASKVRGKQEQLNFDVDAQPYLLANHTLDVWEGVWRRHDLSPPELPPGHESWPALPGLDHHQVRAAIRKFSTRAAAGPSHISPRCLDALSDQALERIAKMFLLFE